VNKEVIHLYWDIGRIIVSRQRPGTKGKSIVNRLAKDLQSNFPGMSGFSAQNLWYMRQFYLEYQSESKLQPLVGEISWSKHLIIMGRCKDIHEREFYIRMTRQMGWTKSTLTRQIQTGAFQAAAMGQSNFKNALPEPDRDRAAIKMLGGGGTQSRTF
jgi:predicted nuclease of restriction endonuclease-like (RecB) superfamily